MRKRILIFLLIMIVILMATQLASAGPAACDNRVNNTHAKLLECVTVEGVREHQAAFQAIADANNGIRTSGTPGYDQSVDYVVQRMTAAGYNVTVQDFEFQTFISLSPSVLEQVTPPPAGPIVNNIMSYSGSGDNTASVSTLSVITGCNAADFAGFPAGNIALISRGACTFALKATNAYNAGAAGVIIYNNIPGTLNGTLGNGFTLDISVTSVTQAVGQQLAATPGLVMRLKTDTFRGTATTSNVLAESKKGNSNNVIMAGAHLDSVNAGPGIQDNGSGSAALLEVAEQMAKVKPRNMVRFAWWGAEESGLVGSTYYVNNLSQAQQDKITLYLNFDMIGSPNYVFFVYDGDDSDGVGAGQGRKVLPRSRRFLNRITRRWVRRLRALISRVVRTMAPSLRLASHQVGYSPAQKASRLLMRPGFGAVQPEISTIRVTISLAIPSKTSACTRWM